MTLLEAIVATAVLSVVAVACLEGTRSAAALDHTVSSHTAALAVAEAAMAEAAATGIRGATAAGDRADGLSVAVRRLPYARRGVALELLTVEVRPAQGAPVRLARLVPAVPAVPR